MSSFAALSRAAARHAAARWRAMGMSAVSPDWVDRAATCERCAMRVVHRGTSYCGTPLLRRVVRDSARDGCGCPTRDKARAPDEHCPVNDRYERARPASGGRCDCKWCAATRPAALLWAG
jgi:hypothetical protein